MDEVDSICKGLKQNAAKVRYLEGLGLSVARRPDGSALVNRAHYDAVRGGGGASPADAAGPRWKSAR